MKILMFGCIHSRFDLVCEAINALKPDLAVLLGDLQTLIEESDMNICGLKAKYRKMGFFHELVSNKLSLSCPTVCIGGNHENVRHLAPFIHGGFLLKNLFYLGSGYFQVIINKKLLNIAAVSGTSAPPTQNSFRFDKNPFLTNNFSKSELQKYTGAYLRDVQKIPVLNEPTIVISHDWPLGIARILVQKEGFRADPGIGGPVSAALMKKIKNEQSVYACAHMHYYVDQEVIIPKEVSEKDEIDWEKQTKGIKTRFIALSKAGLDGAYQMIEFPDSDTNKQNGVWSGEKFLGNFETAEFKKNVIVKSQNKVEIVNGELRVELE
ncbi:Calcineurin-like_phosphoesterase [Hexamita inflata]|uniref:Calcineurin-like phosphoesterase n=1 Tax=Hexamita inflata TaxID=28002 RepID=A0AA86U703_9EUKA|nr:Calcineurin-like phosphoesterase [Hexamita inflata]